MHEKLPKRLVSKEYFMQTQASKTLLYFMVGFTLFAGCVFGGLFLISLLTLFYFRDPVYWITILLFALLSGGLSIICCVQCKRIFVEATVSEAIEPISVQNARHLPLKETLVRPSDLPPLTSASRTPARCSLWYRYTCRGVAESDECGEEAVSIETLIVQ